MNLTLSQPVTLSRRPLSEEVSQYLVDAILSGKFAPGNYLPTEQELCETLQVSRTAVREALKIVSAKGLLITIQGKGTMVNPSPLQALSAPIEFAMRCEGTSYGELLDMRLLLEREAARLAAERITDNELEKMRYFIQALRDRATDVPSDHWENDPEVMFHKTMVDASHHSVLRVLYLPLIIVWTRSLHELLKNLPQQPIDEQQKQPTLRGHEQIYHALETHDPVAAANAVQVHLQEAQRMLQMQQRLASKLSADQ